MEIRLFGKQLFAYKRTATEILLTSADKASKTEEVLPDFYAHLGSHSISDYAVLEDVAFPGELISGEISSSDAKKIKEKKPEKGKNPKTPKGVYEMKLLNDDSLKINTDEKYVDEHIASFKDKLEVIGSQNYDMRNGVNEISSILQRMENRKKYPAHKEFFEQFPLTKTTKIAEVIKNHDNLKIDKIGQFIAEMPKDAIQIMKDYDAECKKLCGKKAVFYIIADEKDFKKTNMRKDPILLAQSPFGHFWNVLGAWDAEMQFLEEL